MFALTTSLRVRYAETDQMGVVYYGAYATYLEVARVEAMRAIGMSYAAIEASGTIMPVLDLQIKYVRPARYDDELFITVRIPQVPSTRMLFQYEIKAADGTLLTTAETTLVFVNCEKGRPCAAPAALVQGLQPYFPSLQ